jgi:hypothetical protein
MIGIGEVQTGLFFSSRKSFAIRAKVTSTFLQVLRNKPAKVLKDKQSNAYVFGPLFDSDYELLGVHASDTGGTGIVDITHMTKPQAREIGRHPVWDTFDSITSPRQLRQVQKLVSRDILFVGSNMGGLGSEVYAHYNKQGHVDGLILNNNYFEF